MRRLRRRHRLYLAASSVAIALLLAGLSPAAVLAATRHVYSEGALTPLSIADTSGITLTPLPGNVVAPLPANAAVLSFGLRSVLNPTSPGYGGVPPDPRSLQWLGGGHLLVADRNSGFVREFDASGNTVWSYSAQDAQGSEAPLLKPFFARRFTRVGQVLTLIVDRNGKRVFVVDEARRIVWQYGEALTSGNGVDRLVDPFSAEYVKAKDPANDTILITEDKSVDPAASSQLANRVIEVRYADYKAGAPNDGFSAQSIVWQYGSGAEGAGVNELFKPHSAERLANGDTLITDADNDRVIEVRTADYDPSLPDNGYHAGPHPSVVWQYGVTNVQSGDAGQPAGLGYLADPNYAERLRNGHTLIADTGHNRVIDVDAYGDARAVQLDRPNQPFDPGVEPRAVVRDDDGRLLIADSAKNQVIGAGFVGDQTASSGSWRGTAVSGALDCRNSQLTKRFLVISWGADDPLGTKLRLYYRIDPASPGSARSQNGRPTGTGWLSAGTRGTFTLPAGSVGKTIQYFVRLSTTDRSVSPALTSVSVEYTRWTGPSTKKRESRAIPAGSVWMGGPSQPMGAGVGPFAAGSGYGTGSGSGGGSGVGTSSGSGTGSGLSQRAAGTGASAASSTGQASSAGQVPATTQPASGAQQVTGEVVGAGSVGGGSQPGGGQLLARPANKVLVWVAIGAGVLLLAWSVAAGTAERRRRALVAYEHMAPSVPRRGPPLLKGLP
jgi:hypothetical protein